MRKTTARKISARMAKKVGDLPHSTGKGDKIKGGIEWTYEMGLRSGRGRWRDPEQRHLREGSVDERDGRSARSGGAVSLVNGSVKVAATWMAPCICSQRRM